MDTSTRYAVVVEPALEVTLVGTASLAVWQPHLEAEGLRYAAAGDTLPVVLSATQARYWGMTFREFSLSLLLNDSEALLFHAFNSNRFFAWVERSMFHTPYYPAAVSVAEQRIALQEQGVSQFEATLPPSVAVVQSRDEHLERRLWLKRLSAADPRAYFDARLEGFTRYFDAAGCRIQFAPAPRLHPALDLLARSSFQVQHWTVRSTARHSKGQTIHPA